ncbi:hypothetical protein BDZ91DRAFT_736573 [Kalaharituber pfeilii]|nr:hypothetical protein BDZ91DRAFT_736573 [Kalaharituber pfeilii]
MGFLRKSVVVACWVWGLMAGQIAQAACAGNLLVDDFAHWANNKNSLGGWTNDDGTMTAISAMNNTLTFTPAGASYLYTTFNCISATAEGYTAITFPVKIPPGGTFQVQLQTSADGCAAQGYQSFSVGVSNFSGETQTVTIPLTVFAGANLAAVKAIVWGQFLGGEAGNWELGRIEFVCPDAATLTTATVGPTGTASTTAE